MARVLGTLGSLTVSEIEELGPAMQTVISGLRVLILAAEHFATISARPWIELRTERKGLLQMLNEDADFGGHPTTRGPHGKDWHCSFKRSEKTHNSTFPEFCGEEPCWRLGDSQMFKDTHPHLFDIAGSKHSFGDHSLRVWSDSKAPRLHGTSLDKDDRLKAVKIVWRFRRAMSCEVLRSCDENGHRLRESSRNQSGIWEIP